MSFSAFVSAERARGYGIILAAGMLFALLYGWTSLILGHHPGAHGPRGLPGASDFLSFWTAGRFALHGNASDAYTLSAMGTAEAHTTTGMEPGGVLAFFYPPPFLLLCLPFAALPYLAGFFTFVAAQTAVLVLLLRRILPRDWGFLPILAFPGLLLNAATGQNGFLSAACFAAACVFLAARPALAGACLGALVIKPHLALAVPIALLCARRWRALAACAATAAGLMLLSWAVLGTAAWLGFLHAAPDIRAALEAHREDWGKLQSIFTSARILGAPLRLAYAAQAALAAAALAVLALACLRRPGAPAEMALTATAAMLCTPHLLDYDLAVTGVPLAWLAAQASTTGWRPYEKAGAVLAFLWPLLARILTQSYDLAIAPLIMLALFTLVLRRARPAPAGAPA